MPIYEYRCGKCGRVSEFLVGVTQEKTDLRCKSCNGTELERIMSAGVISSGSSSRVPYECKSCPGATGSCSSKPCCPHDE